MTPEEIEALPVAEVERQFARKQPHERFFEPVRAPTAFGTAVPAVTPIGMVLPAEVIVPEPDDEPENVELVGGNGQGARYVRRSRGERHD